MIVPHLRPVHRWLLPIAFFATATIALTWPVLSHLGSRVPHDAGDPILNTWILWWSTRSLPLSSVWWNAPIFYPMSDAMALSEVLIALLPITAPVQLITGNPIAAYNTAFTLSFLLSCIAAYALALELTGRASVAVVAAIAFGFAPFRMQQLPHVQMLSYYWAPIALLALHRYLATKRTTWLWIFASAWLLQSLANGYALFHVSVLVVLWLAWFARPWRAAVPILTAWAAAAALLAPLLLKYRQVHAALNLTRSINEVRAFSIDLSQFLSAPSDLAVWGRRLVEARPETAAFPGLTVVAILSSCAVAAWASRSRLPRERPRWTTLAAAGVAATAGAAALSIAVVGPWSIGTAVRFTVIHKPLSIATLAAVFLLLRVHGVRQAWRDRSVIGFYVAATIAMYVLALGPAPTVLGRQFLYEPPYAWLMRLPGFAVLRVPARFAMLAVLCQSMVIALLLARSAFLRRPTVLALVCAGLLVDGWVRLPTVPVPSRGPEVWANTAAVLEMPPGVAAVDFGAIYRAMFHGRPVVNGFSGYAPPDYGPLVTAIRDREYGAILELARYGAVGVAIDQATEGAEDLVRGVAAVPGVTRVRADAPWATFVVPAAPSRPPRLGTRLPIASVSATHHAEDVSRMLDGAVQSAWGSGADQSGDETLIVDLGSDRDVGAIVLEMGSFAFGFPRMLRVQTSTTGEEWNEVWAGTTALLALRAALADPRTVPLLVELPPTRARYLRLRQAGREAGTPWWIAELHVHAPAS